MFNADEFLAKALEAAGSQAEMGRVLGLPSSRMAEMFGGGRRLKLHEAVKLAEEYGIPLAGPTVNADTLRPILQVCLRYPPKGGWTEQAVSRLAEEIEYGLGLLRSVSQTRPSQDALDVAARAIADRLRDKSDREAPTS